MGAKSVQSTWSNDLAEFSIGFEEVVDVDNSCSVDSCKMYTALVMNTFCNEYSI